jgi:hypothetical protein
VDVQFEYPTGIEFVDLVVRPDNLAIEVKFHRPIPSGKSRPRTAQFGEILNDVRKLASADATRRVLVLVTDDTGMTHLRNKDMLPVRSPESVSVGEADIRGLAITAQKARHSAGHLVGPSRGSPHLEPETLFRTRHRLGSSSCSNVGEDCVTALRETSRNTPFATYCLGSH